MPTIAMINMLVAAIIYTFGVLFLKRATDWRPGPWRVTFVVNLLTSLIFAPMWLWADAPVNWQLIWQPIIVAFLFVGGQVLVVIALSMGDVSIATPLLGLKILMVTLLSVTYGLLVSGSNALESPAKLFAASLIATVAIAIMSLGNKQDRTKNVLFTAATSIAAAACYAIFDFLLQVWGPNWTTLRFMPLVMMIAGVISFSLVPFFDEPITKIQPAAWPWIAGGAVCMAIQALFLTCTLTTFGYAAESNVIYSVRGLLTVVFIWLFGQFFSREEKGAGSAVLRNRLIGAALLTLAIFLVI